MSARTHFLLWLPSETRYVRVSLENVRHLGFIFYSNVCHPDTERIRATADRQSPTDVQTPRSFRNCTIMFFSISYARSYSSSTITSPLLQLTVHIHKWSGQTLPTFRMSTPQNNKSYIVTEQILSLVATSNKINCMRPQ
ncbi:hypothetical protein ACTXT7_017261 [Hymenolepis weldensis]